jgi:uncharacterized protein (TIGR02466 family)
MTAATSAPPEVRAQIHWATQIFTVANPGHAAVRDELVRYCYELEERGTERSTVAPAAKGNMFESKFNLFHHDNAAVQALRQFCLSAVHEAAARANAGLWDPRERVQIGAVESWCHITRDGGYHDVHAHPMCSWCGIYYVTPGDSDAAAMNGVNRFYEPRGLVNFYSDHGTRYLQREGSIDVPAREGHAVVFPSYLRHSALPYRGGRDRIVVAFNTRCVRAE